MPIPSQYAFIAGTNDFYINGTKLDDTCTGTKRADNQDVYPFTKGNLYSQSFNSANFSKYRETPSGSYQAIFGLDGITKIEVTEGESNVSVTYTLVAPYQRTIKIPNTSYYYAGCTPNGNLSNGYISVNGGQYWNDTSGTRYNTATFTTLLNALNYIYQHYFNIELWVNGEQWLPIPPIVYTWSSVPSISGKNGILSYTALKDNLITGDAQSNLTANDFTQIIETTRLDRLAQNIPIGVEQDVAYAGKVDRMTIKPITNATKQVKFYVGINTYSFNVLLANFNAYLAFIIDEEQEVAKVVLVKQYIADNAIRYNFTPNEMTDDQMHLVWLYIHGHTSSDDTDDSNINEPIPDNDGTIPYQDTAIEGLTLMTKSAINTGFTKMYKVTDEELRGLSSFLWSDSFLDNVKKFFNDPREIIVGLSIMPISPDTEELSSYIKAGGVTTTVLGYLLTSQYKLMTFGEINISEQEFTRKFLHYPPYTRITAHLPFVGEHSLDVNDITGHKLTLKYCFDFLTGSCVAEIDKDDKPRYFFGGSCGMQIPTSSEDFSRLYSGILSAGATIGSTLATIATGGMSAPMLMTTGANMIANGVNMTPAVQYSSGSGSINGMLGSQTAFLVIEKPYDKLAKHQNRFVGKPSLITAKLENCSGYIKALAVHLDKFAGTETERQEAENALLSGVRIESGSSTPTYSGTLQALIFLKCESDRDIIGKSWSQETGDILTIEATLLYDQSIRTPRFLLTGDVTAYNYCYIPMFNRFYYINEIVERSGTQQEISLAVDVLQSFKDDILDNTAMLDRAEHESNSYFGDAYVWTQQNKEVCIVPFLDTREGKEGEELKFDRPSNSYILTVAGG